MLLPSVNLFIIVSFRTYNLQGKVTRMLGTLILLAGISSCLCQASSSGIQTSMLSNSTSQKLFAQCPDVYATYCHHGTCRFLIAEEAVTCICFKGYLGSQCQYVDLLQVTAEDPDALNVTMTSVTAILVMLSFLASVCVGICFCSIRSKKNSLTLLDNSNDANGLKDSDV
ncbi:protransforming growth factor alpha-like isoform X3 [Rhinatrema bivittatum]|uniref:protransforming growth factor alpha-like isoform X3 n=1 Tax=Rhinatrema bivittatum TaxID=194408 RepID=UPI00112BD655|nr:protransforming growth factor alpha-like isoform X3 [Rhinatrema bivittatum]